MFVVFRPDPIADPLRLQYVFLAHDYLGVLVLAVGSKDFAGNGLAIFFGVTTRRRIHLKQHAFFVCRRIFGLHAHRRCESENCNHPNFHHCPPRKRLLLPADRKMNASCARTSRLGTGTPALPQAFSSPWYKGCPRTEKYKDLWGSSFARDAKSSAVSLFASFAAMMVVQISLKLLCVCPQIKGGAP